MWVLANKTPYAAQRCFARDRHGAETWVVIVKGTFQIAPDGSTPLASHQEPVCLEPRYRGEPGKSSLLHESDLEHDKPTTDVLLHGHAHAPRGRAVTELDVGFRVGRLTKMLRVFGDRRWRSRLGMTLEAARPFLQMPLTYERAFGGVDAAAARPASSWESRNPVGVGFAVEARHLEGHQAPNVELPSMLIRSWRDRPRPAGMGPVARDWSPRRELAGTFDSKWEQDRQPLLPVDFNDHFRQCAPEDQQTAEPLRGGEPVALLNLTTDGELRFTLPRVWLTFRTRLGREDVEHRARMHTVILEPDARRVVIVWGTSLRCHGREHQLERTVIREKPFM
ncbi:DUF2169 domain-containing protein [Myxococcus llanfairpwllgwyngyllgogerychwyrndrobwllllantysiliogogogochensis]|uniref:DUF2169 domain-containing protein n=1 Tax=Myxococcus llanfairpwllgwyngyllgogerychwyrndrobwllllantysiliogogogochensis TaxID=2590453 RepID=A0A540WW50_9BACT|nr:DUF2169 domain-containing protein [Myxococcus llanfairpwllgwyngyllgogerychwyrndrobwllllantysiliogogogochensis]TQF13243.1 DUF2169 domain-containing protein [Myxococcus llanfairpwllgwyngyllgogerychwyrndrobwllllantysiliogogogochensis]